MAGDTFELFDTIKVDAIDVLHGNLQILGFRIKNFAYITDASFISDQSFQSLFGLDILVLNALQYRKHYSHFNYDEAIEIAKKIGAEKTYFTHRGVHPPLAQEDRKGAHPHRHRARFGLLP